ncbi:carbohydrate ABC transporter membrane protein 1, CUT1 family [Rhodospirillales bacterium URHD0017]|nr:carbohydrate ABC transporter membrane protein 1, CUT1 family [Rhodospirillales bacterium URHD0017]
MTGGRLNVVLLTAPAVLLMLVFLVGPLLCLIALSFTDYQLGAPSISFVGLANYDEMTGDDTVRISIGNTLIYVAIVVPVSVALGLGAALLIDADGSLRGFYSAAYFLPVMATLIAMAIVWGFMLDPRIGAVNFALKAFGFKPLDFLHDRKLVLFTLCGIGIWQSVGFNMVLFMAGLTAIPSELYEAAAIDGARRGGSRFALVTWPMLAPVTLFTVVITAIRAFQVFDTVQVLTDGGPNKASEVLLHTIYAEAFGYFRVGYAAALVVVFLVFILALSAIRVFVLDRGRQTS